MDAVTLAAVSKDIIKDQQSLAVLTLYYASASVSKKMEQENYSDQYATKTASFTCSTVVTAV